MGGRVQFLDSSGIQPIHDEEAFQVNGEDKGQRHLVVSTPGGTHGRFKAATRTTGGTTIITEPASGGAVVLTDMIVTTDKVSQATVTVRFTDGSNTINIVVSAVNDAPANFAIAFAGLWRGWKDARIELVTVNNVAVTVAVGYFKILEGESFSTWDAKR